jgi:hypothetical protein
MVPSNRSGDMQSTQRVSSGFWWGSLHSTHPTMAALAVLWALPLLSLLGAATLAAEGQGRVELQLFTEERIPLTAQQDWLQALTKAGVTKLRIVAGAPDKISVEVRGTEASPVYVVTGLITSDNDLLLPNGKYPLRNAGQAAKWLSDLAQNGLPAKPEEKGLFGLKPDEVESLRAALAQPVGFSTQGVARAAAVEKLAGQLELAVKFDAALRKSIGDDAVAEELTEMAGGTAMACLLRPSGLGLVPRRTAQRSVECVILASRPGVEAWPIGWEPAKSIKTLVPAYYEAFSANVENVPVTTVIDAVAKRLSVPFLVDHYALAQQKIDPEKALANAPQAQTTYNQLLRKLLSQANLKSEVRVDEAGKPLFWITPSVMAKR